MAVKSSTLMKARTFADMGMSETAQALWASAAASEERIAPLLEALNRPLEASMHRVSAASCHQKAGELSRAINLYQAALAGPLRDTTRAEVQQMLAGCVAELRRTVIDGMPANQQPIPVP
jgi:hypothetical protein